MTQTSERGFVELHGGRQHNLKNVHLRVPRDALVLFTGVSGSGKSTLAFQTLYAEAQRRYLESVSPYARRLFNQMPVPEVDRIDGLPPAVALQQQRGTPSARSSVGSVTTLANLLRMLYSRAGDYPQGQPIIYADGFSANTPTGACPTCHGLGQVHEVTEKSLVPDPNLTIRQRAIAAWPLAWGGQNLRDILTTLGYDVDTPWKDLPKRQRDWILFTDEQPQVPVYPGYSTAEVRRARRQKAEPSYQGTFSSARRYVMHTYAQSQSARNKARVGQFLRRGPCLSCHGKRLTQAALAVRFAGLDIAEMSALSLDQLQKTFAPFGGSAAQRQRLMPRASPQQRQVAQQIADDLLARLAALADLGLGYLTLLRGTPSLSPGELQRLRLATQVRANLFGVVYVLDEPSAGLHPADTAALMRALQRLKRSGNSLFVVEHEAEVIKHADWIVEMGPGAGEAGGEVLYSGPLDGLRHVEASRTRPYLFARVDPPANNARPLSHFLKLRELTCNNLRRLRVDLPLQVLACVTGISGSGKSTLVSQVLPQLLGERLGGAVAPEEAATPSWEEGERPLITGKLSGDAALIKRLVRVDQKAIGRTPRSNLATYTGLFDHVRRLFAATPAARKRRFGAGHFSFNAAHGRCPTCQGEGSVMVELLFLPSVYSPCPQCAGTRYAAAVLQVTHRGHSIADVLQMRVDAAAAFFVDVPAIARALRFLQEVGLGYLRLGQSATELSGGEAQRIKLAFELQRPARGGTLYILDEPTTGLHPADVDKLLVQLQRLVEAGNSVIVVEHDMRVIAACDYVIDMGPGAGDAGGEVVYAGPPQGLRSCAQSVTGHYFRQA